ncbi:aquaporin-like protein, partial [Umbelopsis sp. PMI_123]
QFREPLSEFLGTCMLLCLACGCIAQHTLSLGQSGNIYIGRALALMMPIYVSGGISGGHLNPSVTITLACFRGFPWRKVPIYIGAQLLGAFTGAAIVYGAYHESIVEFSKQNDANVAASIFYTNALPYLSNGSAFLVELIGTAIMLLVVLGQSDDHNMPSGRNSPLVIGLVIVSIGVSFGWETGFSLNPAADLGGRCLAAMGWGHNVFTIHHGYTWVPIVAPIAGGLLGGFLYEFFIDSESNRALSHRWRAPHKL